MLKRVRVDLDPLIHDRIRELARRKRVQIGLLYEEALRDFLGKPENYLGEDKKILDSRKTAV